MNIYQDPQNNMNLNGGNNVESNLLIQKYSSSFASICKKDIKFIRILFPSFKRKSITFYFTVCLVVTFIVTLYIFFNRYNPLYIDEVNLSYLGLMRYFVTNKYEYYRILTATFFHADIWSLLINTYYFMNLGGTLELKYGPAKYLGVLLLTTLSGNSIICASAGRANVELGIGSILAGFAGVFLAEIIIHYKEIRDKFSIIGNYMLTFLLLFLTTSLLAHNGNIFGVLGGILGGIYFVYAFGDNTYETSTYKTKIILILLAVVYFAACFAAIIAFKY